jgi:outer membrane immunogenic protein
MRLILPFTILCIVASPAASQTAPHGLRVTALIGTDVGGDRDRTRLGGSIGYDFGLGGGQFAGLEVGAVNDGYAVARLGTTLGPRTNVYLNAGVATSHVRVTDPSGNLIDEDRIHGARIGGGAEFRLSSHVFATTEYRYTNYELGLETHQLVGGVGLRF